jgi:hypothetical protein
VQFRMCSKSVTTLPTTSTCLLLRLYHGHSLSETPFGYFSELKRIIYSYYVVSLLWSLYRSYRILKTDSVIKLLQFKPTNVHRFIRNKIILQNTNSYTFWGLTGPSLTSSSFIHL